MKDSLLELIAISAIMLGILLCFFLIFDYTPVDSFFLEKDDDNAFLQGTVMSIRNTENYTLLEIYACKTFDAYIEGNLSKKVNESIHIQGSLSDDLFIVEKYY
ncbi:MAG: hypothetical protein ACP5N3_03925 [Candidatus Nanoarchaeia archaeon]